jgi:thymidylate synthase
MIAHVTGLTAKEFIHTMGDTHVYSNHVEALKTQLERKPKSFPTLKITRRIDDIEGFNVEDFDLEGYDPYPKLEMQMAV